MKRPSRQRVLRAMKKAKAGWSTARFRYIEAVELDSGYMILEYETRSYVPDESLGIHVCHRLATVSPDGSVPIDIITKGWFEKE